MLFLRVLNIVARMFGTSAGAFLPIFVLCCRRTEQREKENRINIADSRSARVTKRNQDGRCNAALLVAYQEV